MLDGPTASRRDMLRRVIGIAAVTPVLAACDLLQHDSGPPPPPDPLTAFHTHTVALAAAYDAAIAASPQLATTLTPIRDTHRAHAAAVLAILRPVPSLLPSASSSAAAGSLKTAEEQAQKEAVEVCLAAPAYRAVLLAEIAAARACHLEVLPNG